MARRAFFTRLAQLAALPFFAATGSLQGQTSRKLKILMKSAWGSDDPTRPHSRSLTRWHLPKPDTKCRSTCSAKRWC